MRSFCILLCVLVLCALCAPALAEGDFALWFNQDGTGAVKAGQQGDLPIFALEDMAPQDKSIQVDGTAYFTVQGTNNPKYEGSSAKGQVPENGAAMQVVAPADGTITVHGVNGTNKDGTGKTFWQVKTLADGSIAEANSTTQAGPVSMPVAVKAGESVWFYCSGSKFWFAGITFEGASPAADAGFTFTFNADGVSGVAAGTAADGHILILEDMAPKENTITLDGLVTYTVQGTNNPKQDGANAKGVVPDSGAAITVTAPADGTITVHGINGTNKDGTGKTFWQVKVTDGAVTGVTSLTDIGQISVPVAVKMGETVWFYCNGSKFQFAQVDFAPAGETAAEPAAMAADQRPWQFTAFGTSTSGAANTLAAGADIGDKVSLTACTFDEQGDIVKKGGKFVSDAPADGVSFYYTTVDPTRENFILTADVTIDYVNPTPDGQEGFALQLRDSIAGSGSYYANTMSVGSAKLRVNGANTASVIGTRNYTGIVDSEQSDRNSVSATLEAFTSDKLDQVKQGATYRVQLEKTSYGYITSQFAINADGSTGEVLGSHTYYIPAKDPEAVSVSSYGELDDPMCVQEPNAAYLALVCARGVNATFSNIQFVTGPWNAADWMPPPTAYVQPKYQLKSAATASGGTYPVIFNANADGVASIKIGRDVVEENIPIKAGVQFEKAYPLTGTTNVSLTFTPDADFVFGPREELASYAPQRIDRMITYFDLGDEQGVIYVTPDGAGLNTGDSFDAAVSVQTALEFAAPGQKILLAAGHYDLSNKTITVERGRDGTREKPIVMTCEDGMATFDFGRTGKGFTCWGDWWQMSNINITGTADKKAGMQLSGHHCTLRNMNFYNNGTTGLQISGTSYETIDTWPSNNTIISCTAMNNGDSGYEDADGFAAKLTCGEGNVFIGCISAYNADDGWDLFAKAATGEIGAVTIRDSVCYRNGYLLVKPESTASAIVFADIACDEGGNLVIQEGDYIRVDAGNGNGFKMGGTNLPGGHRLINSIAYENKSKGIDANSCPDIRVQGSTSFNNGGANVALYTNNKSAQTAYQAKGILSFRTTGKDTVETIKLSGQSAKDVYGGDNFYWNGASSMNGRSIPTTAQESWFASLDTSIPPIRKEDGTIDMHGLLMLTEEARLHEAGAQGAAYGQQEQEKATFWVVGDSTVSAFDDGYYVPREGWGEALDGYFAATVYNLARSGASSKDFTGMDEYQTLMHGSADVPALGDAEGGKFLLIGFGHNDQKTEQARFTDPNGDHTVEGSFANSLYTNYVKPALDADVTPVLVTPMVRLTDENTAESYVSESGHITEETVIGEMTYPGGDYAAAIRRMAAELDLICLDLTAATLETNLTLGEGAQYLHSFNGAKLAEDGVTMLPTALDKTHTSMYGAKMNAWLLARAAAGTALEAYVKPGKVQPTYETEFLDGVNPEYAVVPYAKPEGYSARWPEFTDAQGTVWHGTVMGDVGGESKIDGNFGASASKDGLTLLVTDNAGKISSATDGMIFYYVALPAGQPFTLTAKATINDLAANNQVSFGLMARDELYLDTYVKETTGDYVAAGTRNQGAYNCFGRKSGELFNGPAAEKVYTVGDTVTLSMTGTADGYTLTYGENAPVSAGFDYPLTTIDDDHIYVGMYAVRNAYITFSDVNLTLD